jgi:uncharacterized protein (UPF0332 family)
LQERPKGKTMSTKERQNRYREAVRYISNASEILRTKAQKKDKYYQDDKYVRMACATAYNGVLLAADTYLEMKGKAIEKKKGARVSVDDYRTRLAKIDKSMLRTFNTAYEILHLVGYYEGETNYSVIRAGIDSAIDVINQIKPAGEADLQLNQLPS